MIISHKFRCIYIKLAKVAGTSFEIALSKYCGADDIIPRPYKKDSVMRRVLGFWSTQNCNRHMKQIKFGDHIEARDIKERIPEDIWDNYLKVATIRCPYDMLISQYYWSQHVSSNTIDFERYVAKKGRRPFRLIYGLHEGEAEQSTGVKKLLTDFLIRYEHLDEDIKELEIRINCPRLLDTFQSTTKLQNIRPKVGTAAYEMYAKYPAVKKIVDKRCKKAAKEYEFFSRYWPAYKARLEAAIKDHGDCSG